MDPVSNLNHQIYQEASEWFVECRSGDLDIAMRQAFDSWLRKSPEHLRAYLELSAIWNEGALLDPQGKYDQETLIAAAAADRDNVIDWSGARANFDVLPAAPPATRAAPVAPLSGGRAGHRPSRLRLAAIAASLLLAAAAAALFYLRSAQAPSYATAIGEQRSLALMDGSIVELNSRSKIVVRYTPQGRNVELLQGQALFRVAKDADRPFIVKTGATLVRAVGTEFDVYQKRDGTVVTVVEGRVAILTGHALPQSGATLSDSGAAVRDTAATQGAADEPHRSNLEFPTVPKGQVGNILVAAGEQLTVTPKLIKIAEHPNIATATAWTQRQLVFESASLSDVADEFNRYNDRQLMVADPRLGTFHVSGVFSSTDPASLIRFLRARPELRVIETESQIRIEKNAP
jgi:transmembrane sensor